MLGRSNHTLKISKHDKGPVLSCVDEQGMTKLGKLHYVACI